MSSKRQSIPIEEGQVFSDDEELYGSDDEGTRIDGIYIPPATKPTLSFDPTGPRLMITKIYNNFFKSYAENIVLGPFHKCFNAIVGPNGSGKSNVIDSLLFVFGYRATKIRCKKVSVLLHNSENFKNIQSCTVSINFALIVDKDRDSYEVVPGSEFTISRTANKDNSSYYEMDGKRVQFKDVAKVLKKHGIDLDYNRFLILQGEVEQIAMMKCKGEKEGESGMLEYLEDIIGTTRYKKPLEQINERVDMLSEKRTEKLNRLRLVENELEQLKEPMEEAVGFLKTENKIVQNKNFLFQKAIKDIKAKTVTEKENCEEALTAQKIVDDKLKEFAETKEKYMQTQDREAKIYEHLKKKKESISEAYNNADKKDMQLQADMTSTNNRRKKNKETIVLEKKKLTKLENVPKESEENIIEYEAKMQSMIKQKEQHENEKSVLMKKIQKDTEHLQIKKEKLQEELSKLKENVDKTKSNFALAETELKVCIGKEETERTKLENLKKLYETSQTTIDERIKQVQELKKKIPVTEKSLNDANVELLEARQNEATLVNKIRSKRGTLEDGKCAMQASRSSGRVLDELMRAKREGKCPGLFGRLGDLGAIDQKYDVAISTACGPLDNIVVDTVDTAQWCIEFLKRHDIGRAVFIALEKQEHLRNLTNSRIQTPENVHRLYDLVKVNDERVKTAFYYALRDTLVANDLNQASRIAYGARRYRVVTLNGDLIETTGTMSGGGRRQMRGRMGQSVAIANVNPADLQALEQELQAMENNVRDVRQRQNYLESQISEMQPQLKSMKIDLDKYSQELKSLQQQQPNIARQIKQQEAMSKSTKADAKEVQRLTAIVEQKRKDYDAASKTASVLQIQVDQINKEIKEKTTGKIRKVENSIKECTKIIEMCKSETAKVKVAVKTAERNYKTTKENITRMEQDVEAMENSLRAMKKERDEMEEDAKKLLTCIEEITEQLQEKEKLYSEAKKEVEGIMGKENKLKSEKIDVDEKVNIHNKKLKEFKAAIRSWESKLNELTLQDIPNQTAEELQKFTDEELENKDAEHAERELKAAENHLKAAKPNLHIIQEYRKKETLYISRAKEFEEVELKRTEMRQLYDKLRNQRKEEFISGYNIIKLKLKEMYQMITLGGDADFEMVDTYDPFTEGVQFNVRPPRKTWKKISNLSGGEKTLSSLALVFALHYYKPSPLYIMDEIDAALDFRNVSIVGNYIKERTTNAQFIIISLRSNMFELCDNLVGIYKTYNTTKTITINPKLYDNGSRPTLNNTELENLNKQNTTLEGIQESQEMEQSESTQRSEGQTPSLTPETIPETPEKSSRSSEGDSNKENTSLNSIPESECDEQNASTSDTPSPMDEDTA
ncbi:structural maintenance of chromosomes protein 4 [Sitophilus oryzae]|uniref:Structural maintenance of chromosomes protein n=1 Tax=Sitophilus oryzae TaxID=7048 RepID=A0A6J2XGS4_SITOR|nr:structural maintenance of chromosomes protein 4 [Sitophilus oryzae]